MLIYLTYAIVRRYPSQCDRKLNHGGPHERKFATFEDFSVIKTVHVNDNKMYNLSKNIVQFWSCNKAVVNVFPHKAEPSCATRTGRYVLGR